MLQFKNIIITTEILKYISEIDEFKGKWQATQDLAPDRLGSFKRIATIESVGSSTRIEGAKLTDEQVEKLLSKLEQKSFTTRDEQEVVLAFFTTLIEKRKSAAKTKLLQLGVKGV